MTGPAQAAAKPFTAPQEDASLLLARDIAFLIERLGKDGGGTNQKKASYAMGERECLVLCSFLEMDKNASVPDRTARRWDSVRVVAYMQSSPVSDAGERIPLFNAICTDREAIKGAHPTAGLEKLPFVASDIAGGQWANVIRSLARTMRDAEGMRFETHSPNAPRQRAPHWHAT